MAISAIEYTLFRRMREQNAAPLGADLLELGQANWYGDVPVEQLAQDIYRFAREEERRDLFCRLDEIVRARRPQVLFEIAEVFWRVFVQPASLTAIDFHGTERALKRDLNEPLDLGRQFGLVCNLGTAEHVFDIARVMRTIHEATAPGGMMVHGIPFTGWIEHGFYTVQPTFFWDLAAANGYRIAVYLYVEFKPLKFVQLTRRETILEMAKAKTIAEGALLYCVLRKPMEERPFRVPIQGYYAGSISAEAAQAWKTLR